MTPFFGRESDSPREMDEYQREKAIETAWMREEVEQLIAELNEDLDEAA